MTLILPSYIKKANILDNSIRYKWDDWEAKDGQPLDKELIARLKKMSCNAILAYMCATSEWVVYRFSNLHDDPAPEKYIEAAWAMLINVRYCGYGSYTWQEFASEGWEGPVKAPIARALQRLEIAIQQLAWEGTDPARRASLLCGLVKYVLTDPEPYKVWSDEVLTRLESLYPRDSKDKKGDVVPRQALDPDYDFKVDQTEMLLNEYLKSLDYRANEFLSKPDEMIEKYDDEDVGFVGTPYEFDIATDRKSRF